MDLTLHNRLFHIQPTRAFFLAQMTQSTQSASCAFSSTFAITFHWNCGSRRIPDGFIQNYGKTTENHGKLPFHPLSCVIIFLAGIAVFFGLLYCYTQFSDTLTYPDVLSDRAPSGSPDGWPSIWWLDVKKTTYCGCRNPRWFIPFIADTQNTPMTCSVS